MNDDGFVIAAANFQIRRIRFEFVQIGKILGKLKPNVARGYFILS